MPDFTIRLAIPDDADALTRVVVTAGWFEYFQETPFEEAAAGVLRRLSMCVENDAHTMFVATDKAGAAIGFASLHWTPCLIFPDLEGYLSELFVSAEFSGRGVGSALLERAVEEGRARGCYRMMLLNGRTRDSYLRDFYRKHGWTERADIANFVYML